MYPHDIQLDKSEFSSKVDVFKMCTHICANAHVCVHLATFDVQYGFGRNIMYMFTMLRIVVIEIIPVEKILDSHNVKRYRRASRTEASPTTVQKMAPFFLDINSQ